jgi:formate dehydrogenase iron-sulfur subunit
LTDVSLCIGCKACEVAYDNTLDLGATTWRHVAFVEQPGMTGNGVNLLGGLINGDSGGTQIAWLMMSDVCKHCVRAGCMEACPTGAIIRSEYGTVVIQGDICNGCGYCVPACPFGVPELSPTDRKAQKCTLCYDRLKDGLEPACAKSCPTDSIQFGHVEELRVRASQRVEQLKARGYSDAHVYGDAETGGTNGIDGLNAMFVLTAAPETFNLPAAPSLPQDKVLPAYLTTGAMAIGLALTALRYFRKTS